MEVAAQVSGSFAHVAAVASVAESSGFGAIALSDHYLNGSGPADYVAPMFDSLTQAAALAVATRHIEIVTLVSPVTFRHPAVYAKSMSSIDDISNGRFILGLGAGWHADEHRYFGMPFPSTPERFDLLEDALGYLQAYSTAPGQGYRGRFWSMSGFDYRPQVRRDSRLVVGGSGARRTPELAGRFAGEYNLGSHDPRIVRSRVAAMRRAALDAGRDPDRILISTPYRMIAGDSRDEVDELFADWGAPRGLTASEIRERVGDRIPILTWEAHLEQLAGLEQLGFGRVYIKLVTVSTRAFALAAERLTPVLRRVITDSGLDQRPSDTSNVERGAEQHNA